MEIKPLREPSLNTFCDIYDISKGQHNVTCPADAYNISCLRALESRGLIAWDLERPNGKTKRWCALTRLGARYACETMALSAQRNLSHRNRQWVKMQFNMNDPEYKEAHNIASDLARDSLLAPTVASLLRIHKAAMAGDYRLFYELYGIPETDETSQFESMVSMMAKMQATIEGFAQSAVTVAPQSHENGLKQSVGIKGIQSQGIGLKSASIPLPNFDDDETMPVLTIRKGEQSGMQSNKNLIAGLKALQGK